MLRLDNKAGQTATKRVKKNKGDEPHSMRGTTFGHARAHNNVETGLFGSSTSALMKGSWIYRNSVILQIPPFVIGFGLCTIIGRLS